jgi:tellurite resistance protein
VTAPRIPPSFFAIPFGIAGLAGVWLTMAHDRGVPIEIGWILCVASALAWFAVVLGYLNQLRGDRRAVYRDLIDPVASPLLSLALITPMLLSAQGVQAWSAASARVAVDVLVVLVVGLGSWFTGQWIYGPLEVDALHPGYFLPTVAGGLLASYCASIVGQPLLAAVMFGLGLVCWLILGSIMLGRLLVRPRLPTPLLPTLAIEVAPAAIASLAWFRLRGDGIDIVAAVLGGYGLLMVLAQARLLPAYLRLPFMPTTWSFTFSWAAVATTAIAWLQTLHPTGYRAGQYALLVAVSVLIGSIMVRTIVALVTGQFLHPAQAPPAPRATSSPRARLRRSA